MTNWDYFKYYLEVARGGSVSAASRRLGVSHATVLRHIDQLERDLGVKLFRRLQNGCQLSDEGEKLLDKALRMQSAMQDVEQTIHKKSDEMSGVLRVTQTNSDCLNLYDLYAQFSARYQRHAGGRYLLFLEEPEPAGVRRCDSFRG